MLLNYTQRLANYISYRGQKLLKRNPPPLFHYAQQVIEHAPAENSTYLPPITLDGQLERVTGNRLRPVKEVIRNATALDQFHTATVLHRLDGVILDNGFLYRGGRAEYLSSLGMPQLKQIAHEEEAVLCSTSSGARYFGDWMITDNLLECIAQEVNQLPLKVRPHTNYADLPDLNRILQLSSLYRDDTVYIKHLYIPDDMGYNQNKVNRLNQLRKRYLDYANDKNNAQDKIYILRGEKASPRLLTNESEITDYLKTCGFAIINPSELTVDEIASATANSEIIIGVEGSQLSYGTLGIKEGGTMIVIQPPYHFQSSFRPRCASIGVGWGFLVGIENEGGFELPLDDLKRLLERF